MYSILSMKKICDLSPFNPLPNNKIVDLTKFKALEDDKFSVAKMMISLLDRVENTVRKGENAGYKQFLLYPQCFPKPSSLGSLTHYQTTNFRLPN